MKLNKMKFILVSSLFLSLTCLWHINEAFALRVSPGAFSAQNTEVGQKTDTGVDLTIDNDTDKEREFSIKVVQPRMPMDESLKGYSPIPNLDWFYLEKTNIIVPPNGQGKSRIYINIPKEEKYYNQQWIVSCLIEYVGQKGLFQEAIQTLYMIETKSKADVTKSPYGDIAIAPSVLKVKEGAGSAAFKLYNNTAQDCVCTISSFVPSYTSDRLKINVSPGFEWVKEALWVSPKVQKVKLTAGGIEEIKVNVNVPKDALLEGKGVETLIFIESDKGNKRFVRVQVEK